MKSHQALRLGWSDFYTNYGMGRFPVTLYAEQWERLDSDAERKRRAEFIKTNAKELTRKS